MPWAGECHPFGVKKSQHPQQGQNPQRTDTPICKTPEPRKTRPTRGRVALAVVFPLFLLHKGERGTAIARNAEPPQETSDGRVDDCRRSNGLPARGQGAQPPQRPCPSGGGSSAGRPARRL